MDLFTRLNLFASLPEGQKRALFYTAIYNDLRVLDDDPAWRMKVVHERFSTTLERLKSRFNPVSLRGEIHAGNWQDKIRESNYALHNLIGTKPIERSFALNTWLYEHGICPLVRFAFDKWYEIPTGKNDHATTVIEQLADMSTTYLYRNAPIKIAPEYADRPIYGQGAYSNVYTSSDGKAIFKVPHNIAAWHFVTDMEVDIYNHLADTDMRAYIPTIVSYDPSRKIIEKEFKAGTAAWDMLDDPQFQKDTPGLEQIRKIYEHCNALYMEQGINLDIHPGNFLWSEKEKSWSFIDLGPMPEIGAEYFPRDDFDAYFKKIWLDLYPTLRSLRYRSLDLGTKQPEIQNITAPVPNLCR